MSDYPLSAPPKATIEVEKGLGKKHADELQALVDEQAANNVGMPSVFVIAEAVKDWLADNNGKMRVLVSSACMMYVASAVRV